jgi:hypothetical protein
MVPADAVGPSLFRFEGAALLGRIPGDVMTAALCAGHDRSPVRAVGRGVFCPDPGVCRSAP